MIVSIFNDVIGPVMRGPSSSHCAAALRIGRLARDLMNGEFHSALVEFDNAGSLPTTHTSQGSDMGLFGGLLGWDADDQRLPDSRQALADAGIEIKFVYGDYGDEHPNTYRLTLSSETASHDLIAISTGGGMIEVVSIDGIPVSIFGGYDETLIWTEPETPIDADAIQNLTGVDAVHVHEGVSKNLIQIQSDKPLDLSLLSDGLSSSQVARLGPVLPVRSRKEMSVPFQSCVEMMQSCDSETPLWRLGLQYEMQRGAMSEDEVLQRMMGLVRISRSSIDSGLEGTHYEDRVLGFQSGGFAQAMKDGRLLDGGMLNRIVLYTTALMEVKSSMGVIIAAPTAGACAAFPATCIAAGEALNLPDEEIAKGMLAGGMVGVFIATHWSFAAEVGGSQATGAASMAMQNMLGLICDPVANRVEAPCLGKNVMAASNALSCANMALSGFDMVIPLDETIAAARAVAERMPREHRCTAQGGLSTTPTSIAIEKRLAAKCGGSCVCGVASLK